MPEKPIEYSPKISIVTVVLNGKKHLEQTIGSVLSQSYEHTEYIIIDGGSTDGTLDIIQQYKKHITYWISEKDDGIYDAINKGIKAATGEIVYFLNADDYLYNDQTLEDIATLFQKNCEKDLIYGDVILIYKNPPSQVRACRKFLRKNLKKGIPIWHQGAFMKRASLETLGLFDAQYKISGDLELWCRCQKNNIKALYLKQPIAFFRCGGVSDNDERFSESVRIIRTHFGRWPAMVFFLKKNIVEKYTRNLLKKMGLFPSYEIWIKPKLMCLLESREAQNI